tara:strand:+ start:10628 stop:11464 length:837 start_codon:yes stop_codon:yes gene_type:complete
MNEATTGRIEKKFKFLKKEGRAAFIPFIMAADPTLDVSLEILKGLPAAGADIIELGVLFSDPMADGPAIQSAGLRAKSAGANLHQTLSMVREFRKVDDITPIILMGYYNPIYIYGNEKFLIDAKNSGVDGLIVVDLPPEEDKELCLPSLEKGLHFIRLATPTTDENRISTVLTNTSGFVYYVSIAGVTGSKSARSDEVRAAVKNIKKYTELPVAVGFGIKTPEQAAIVARSADAAVVGSAIVKVIENNIDETGAPSDNLVDNVLEFVSSLSRGVRESR